MNGLGVKWVVNVDIKVTSENELVRGGGNICEKLSKLVDKN